MNHQSDSKKKAAIEEKENLGILKEDEMEDGATSRECSKI